MKTFNKTAKEENAHVYDVQRWIKKKSGKRRGLRLKPNGVLIWSEKLSTIEQK